MGRPAGGRRKMTGWKIFLTGDGVLQGPCTAVHAAGLLTRWDSRDFHASCTNRGHVPPARGCRCGVYAHQNLVDARVWMRQGWRYGYAPGVAETPFVVLGRVRLWDAVAADPVAEAAV
jgi:hypothetical protein